MTVTTFYSMCAAVNSNRKYDYRVDCLRSVQDTKIRTFFFFVQTLLWTDPITNEPYQLSLVVIPNWNRQQSDTRLKFTLCTCVCVPFLLIFFFGTIPPVISIRHMFPGVLVTLPGLVKYTLKHNLPSCSPCTPSGTLDKPSGIIKFYYRNGWVKAPSRKVKGINDIHERHTYSVLHLCM